MKALIVPKPGSLQLTDIDPPTIGPYDALVKIEVCGICNSTDAKLIDGRMYWAPPFPFVLGHESVGVVKQVGDKVRKYKVGDRVTRPVAFWPGSRQGLNVAVGGFAEWGMVRDAQAMAQDGDHSLDDDYLAQRQLVVPKNLSPVEAALAISLSETASVFLPLPPLRGRTVAVTGAGVAGLAFMLWAKLAGAHVIAIARRARRLELARMLGADSTLDTNECKNLPAELEQIAKGKLHGIIEATGNATLANQLTPAIEKGGFAVAYGVPATEDTQYDKNIWRIAEVNEQLCYNWVADLLSRGWISADWFVSRGDVPLSDTPAAFEQVRKGELLKVFIQTGS